MKNSDSAYILLLWNVLNLAIDPETIAIWENLTWSQEVGLTNQNVNLSSYTWCTMPQLVQVSWCYTHFCLIKFFSLMILQLYSLMINFRGDDLSSFFSILRKIQDGRHLDFLQTLDGDNGSPGWKIIFIALKYWIKWEKTLSIKNGSPSKYWTDTQTNTPDINFNCVHYEIWNLGKGRNFKENLWKPGLNLDTLYIA